MPVAGVRWEWNGRSFHRTQCQRLRLPWNLGRFRKTEQKKGVWVQRLSPEVCHPNPEIEWGPDASKQARQGQFQQWVYRIFSCQVDAALADEESRPCHVNAVVA